MASVVDIRRVAPGEHDEMVAVLGRAFWPDPMFGVFARGPLHEHRLLPEVFSAVARDVAPFAETWVATRGDRIVGAALWLPPAGLPRGTGRDMALTARLGRLLLRGRNRRGGFRLLAAVEKKHPRVPHWYLAVLGTDPIVRGTGAGSALLAEVLGRADAAGEPAYLETQKEANLAYYERHGFVVRDVVRLDGLPTAWTMWREPR